MIAYNIHHFIIHDIICYSKYIMHKLLFYYINNTEDLTANSFSSFSPQRLPLNPYLLFNIQTYCISQCFSRETESLWVTWNKGFTLGIWFYTVVGAVEEVETCCLCIWDGSHWRFTDTKQGRMTNGNINQFLLASNLGNAGEIKGAGTLCHEAAHMPGTGLRVAETEAAGLDKVQAWWLLCTSEGSSSQTQGVESVEAPGRHGTYNAV